MCSPLLLKNSIRWPTKTSQAVDGQLRATQSGKITGLGALTCCFWNMLHVDAPCSLDFLCHLSPIEHKSLRLNLGRGPLLDLSKIPPSPGTGCVTNQAFSI